MNDAEKTLAELAARKVGEAGGRVTFDEYDALMKPERYFTPMHWIDGWGRPFPERKSNTDKMCAFAACAAGLLRQTSTGYELADSAQHGPKIEAANS